MEEVAKEMNVTFEKIKSPGEAYNGKGGCVPENMWYVSVNAGERGLEFWQKVDKIAPPPTYDDILIGKYLR
jgi:hypothetical protein